jgi:hypothetical protein
LNVPEDTEHGRQEHDRDERGPDDHDAPGVVGRYLASIVAHDWTTMADCVTPDVVRVGPFGDTYEGRAPYVDFISALMPTLPGYHMDVHRIVYSASGRVAMAELTETIELDGHPLPTAESLVFDLDAGGSIGRIAIYLRQDGPVPTLAAAPSTAPVRENPA